MTMTRALLFPLLLSATGWCACDRRAEPTTAAPSAQTTVPAPPDASTSRSDAALARAVAVEPREPQGHSGEPPTNRLAINLEHGFDDSRVTVKCDRNTVLDERLTTEPSAGVAGYVTCPLVDRSLAPVALTVVIDGQAWQAQIDISKGRVLHLERRQERLRVTQSRNQPLYD